MRPDLNVETIYSIRYTKVMITICPAVLAENPHQYREQIERVASFATRIHLDFGDGVFTQTVTPDLSQAWWPHTIQADLHLMYQDPAASIEAILPLNPHMVIVHAESDVDIQSFADAMHQAGIAVGVAMLAATPVSKLQDRIQAIDHVLIFSGDLGHFGGKADLALIEKAAEIRKLRPDISIGWDGGVNADNAAELAKAGVDVLNVGGFIQRSDDPQSAYRQLQTATDSQA